MISIIVPVYNRPEYYDKCLASIAEQTFFDFEVLCVMDGFSPAVNQVTEKWCNKDRRFKKHCIAHSGAAVARNYGINIASGKYLFFCDADDILPVNAMEILWNEAERTGADVVIGDYLEKYDSGIEIPFVTPSGEGEPFNTFLESVTIWHRLFSREYIIQSGVRFDKRFIADDRIFLSELFLTDPTVSVIHKCVYLWLRHESDVEASVTHDIKATSFLNHMTMWNFFFDLMTPDWYDSANDHLCYSCQYILDGFSRLPDCEEKEVAFQALKSFVSRLDWKGYESLFFQIFKTDPESFFAMHSSKQLFL